VYDSTEGSEVATNLSNAIIEKGHIIEELTDLYDVCLANSGAFLSDGGEPLKAGT
jgi:hypothetical protein